jgi:hypothetical protein
LTNTNNTTRIRQTEHIEVVAEAITVAKVLAEALEATVTSEVIAASAEAKATADMTHCLHVKRSAIYTTNQVAGRQSTPLTNKDKYIRDLVNVANTPRSPITRVSFAKSKVLKAL